MLKSKTINTVFYLYNFAVVLAILFFKFEFSTFSLFSFLALSNCELSGKKRSTYDIIVVFNLKTKVVLA